MLLHKKERYIMAKQKFNIKIPKNLEPPKTTSQASNSIAPETAPNKGLSAEPKVSPVTTVPATISIMKEEVSRPIELKYIPRSKIVYNQKNDYNQEEIEKLADSILQMGLIHIMEAYYDEENDVYVLESGERRTRAIDLLLKRYLNTETTDSYEYQCFLKNVKGFANGYPLNVVRPITTEAGELTELEKIDSLLRLDEANIQVRDIDSLQRAKALERRKRLLQRKNELLPKSSRINVNQKLSKETGIKERTIMKYTAVAERLIPELQEEFRKNNISLNDGSAYAQLSEEEQRYILQMLHNGEKASHKELEQLRLANQQHESEKALKEAELEKLKQENAEINQKLNQEILSKKAEFDALEKKLREEIATDNDVNEAAIAALEKALQAKNKELAESKKSLEEHTRSQERDMETLKKELQELKQKPAIDPEEQKILKLSITYETAIKNLESAVVTAYNIYQSLATLVPEKEEEFKNAYDKTVAKFNK